MTRIVKRPFRALVALALTGLLLAGCAQPNTAAVVNGVRYTETDLANAWVDLAPVTGEGTPAGALLMSVIRRDFLVPAAEGFGITATQEEINSFAEQIWASVGAEVPDPLSPMAAALIEWELLAQKVQVSPLGPEIVQVFAAHAATADVSVNPRFGEYDSETGMLNMPEYPWLATP